MRKTVFALLLSIIMLLFFFACGKAAEKAENAVPVALKTGTGYKAEVNEAFDHVLVNLIYPIIALDEEEAKAYPALAAAFQELNRQKKEEMLKRYDEAVEDIYDRLKYYPDGVTGSSIEETIMVRRADTSVVSLIFNGYSYTGGAHGMWYYWGENYDTKTGKKLALSDVVTDINVLPDLVKKQLDVFWSDVSFYEDLDLKKYFQESQNLSWVLDCNGLTFFFNPYDIAPYVAGMQTVTLTYKENPELIKEKYRVTASSYGVELACDNPFFYDFDGDGTVDKLLVSGTHQEEAVFAGQSIQINDEDLAEKMFVHKINPVFIHTVNGNNYLYLEYQLDEGNRRLAVYDLSSGSARKVKEFDNLGIHYAAVASEEEYYPNKAVLTNPDNFFLDTYTDLISSIIGYTGYSVGPDGLPAAKNGLYTFDLPSRFSVTLEKKLKFDVIDKKSGKVTGTKTADVGETVYYYRTDNKSFADFLLPDGSIGRVRIEVQGSDKTVNGLALEKVLSDVVFIQ
ncbi:MAG: DUF3298 domain-containing protein [bacterium]